MPEITSPNNAPGSFGAFGKTLWAKLNASGLKNGALNDEQRAKMPWVVECHGLTREHLKAPELYDTELRARRDWCEENCPDAFGIEPIGIPELLTGRRFRFERDTDAVAFKLTFDTFL